MIADDHELHTMLARIRHFQEQVARLRVAEAIPPTFTFRCPGFWQKSIGCSLRCASTSACTQSKRQASAEDERCLTRLPAVGGRCDHEPPRLKPDVDMTSVVKYAQMLG